MIKGVVDCSARSMFANRMKPWKPGGYNKFYSRFSTYIQMMVGYLSGDKFCVKCGLDRPVTEFYMRKGGVRGRESIHGKLDSYCKDCVRGGVREWRKKNLLRARKSASDWAKKNTLRHRLVGYGLTKERYQEMIAEQRGGCAICLRSDKPLQIDHDHATGKVRGLLCTGCNTALGKFKDSGDQLKRAIAYLEKHNGNLLG